MWGSPAHPGMTLLGIGGVLPQAALPAQDSGFLAKIHDRPLQECGQAEGTVCVCVQKLSEVCLCVGSSM